VWEPISSASRSESAEPGAALKTIARRSSSRSPTTSLSIAIGPISGSSSTTRPPAGPGAEATVQSLGAEIADKVASDATVLAAGGTVFHAGPLSRDPLSPDRRTVGLDESPKSLLRIRVSRETVAAAVLDEAERPRFAGAVAVPLTR
jgi:hypothetical protein